MSPLSSPATILRQRSNVDAFDNTTNVNDDKELGIILYYN